jgi:hypothetical protein
MTITLTDARQGTDPSFHFTPFCYDQGLLQQDLNMDSGHTWKFSRAGGFDQVRLDAGSDLMALDQLDQKLWVALACPATGLEFDSRTLALIDSDNDGRIRAPEIIEAVKWACRRLKNAGDLLGGSAQLPLSAINDAVPEGQQLLASARAMLASLGNPNAAVISVQDTLETGKVFAQARFNGDGIVPADSAEDDAATKAVIGDIIACLGAETDRSGKPGITQAKADAFFAEAHAYSDWWKKAEDDDAILPLGGSTAAAAFQAVKTKVDDYFIRCRLAAFDPRSVNALNREEKDYLAFTAKDLTASSAEIAGLPLAQVAAGRPLPLAEGLNPAWAEAMAAFATHVVRPMFNSKAALSEADWAMINGRFAACLVWSQAKAGLTVEKLGLVRVRQILGGRGREAITALIARDKALQPEADAIAAVERLARYYRDLYKLLNNFVCFRDFYGRKEKAVFQAGTLYLDQRSCDLCITVSDAAKHAVMAGLSGTYLAYCDCVRKSAGEHTQIVAAFTDGDSDNLIVGRNGVFYDRNGRDWDATITRIVDNPISIRQAFWAPYKKAARIIREQAAKHAAAADQSAVANLAAVAEVETPTAKAPRQPAPRKLDPGLIAALSVGAAGLGGMIGSIVLGFLSLKWLMPMGVVGIMLIVSGPSMLLAWLKLHRRNLGPILDANGWAVNAKARINVPFGASLTRVASLPAGAQRDLTDLFAEKHHPWKLYFALAAILLLALCWWHGWLDHSLPGFAKSTTVLGANAPASTPPGQSK